MILRSTNNVVNLEHLGHELLHTLGIDHAFGCGAEDPSTGGLDSDLKTALPAGTVEDVAVKVRDQSVVPQPTSDVMSYCGFTAVSIATTTKALKKLKAIV